MRKILYTSAALLALGACTVGPSNDQVLTVMNQIANTATADLNTAIAVANAATPPDVDGATCAKGVLTIGAAMQKVLAATPQGATVGAFTAAEIASLYQPSSPQFNYVVTTLETACIAKVHDVNQSVQSMANVIVAIPTVLALAAPVK